MQTIERFADFFYGFVTFKDNLFSEYECHAVCFLFLIGVSLVFTLVYYFFIDSNARNATPKNYLSVSIMGYFALVAINYLGLATIAHENVLIKTDILLICLADIIYYILLFELWSLVFKGLSKNSKNIDFISILFNKNI